MRFTMDGQAVSTRDGATVLEAARQADIYIPALCAHPDLVSGAQAQAIAAIYRGPNRLESDGGSQLQGCQLCLVEVNGELHRACDTVISEGMCVQTDTARVREARRSHLIEILKDHPHACLICPLAAGCDRLNCTMNVPVEERCCSLFGRCELQKISEYVGIPPETPRYTHKNLPIIKSEFLFELDYNLCINCLRCVSACNDLRGVHALGFVIRDGRALFGTVGPTLMESGCKFCGACVAVCPTGALMDKGGKKLEDENSIVPCRAGCPAGIDVPRYVRLISEGKCSEALAVVRERVPFPRVLGYVCYHPCETVCRRGELNQPISICRLKRFAAEHDDGRWRVGAYGHTPLQSGKRVAVVGSGPAGLTAAYYLTRKGHATTVFEALPQAGGLMRYGIPAYRLPREALDAEISEIETAGVKIRTNAKVDSIEGLFAPGFDAVYLAAGATRARKLNIPGEELSIDGLSFLRQVNAGEEVSIGARVAVIGGGNVATDCARTALRLRAQHVIMLYRRTRAQMPAYPEEIAEALREGVQIEYSVIPQQIEVTPDGLRLKCSRTRTSSRKGEPPLSVSERGRGRGLEPVTGSEFFSEFDTVFVAIGQEPEPSLRAALEAKQAGVFAGGDLVSGPSSVIEAIAMGRRAAIEIDRYLGGDGDISESFAMQDEPGNRLGRELEFASVDRYDAPCLSMAARQASFATVDEGFSEEVALAEAARCLRCDLRLKLSRVPFPPQRTVKPLTDEGIIEVPDRPGVYQLLDQEQNVIQIKGVSDLRVALKEQLSSNSTRYFSYELADFYTQRESELLQEFLQKHGRLPKGNDELEDLF